LAGAQSLASPPTQAQIAAAAGADIRRVVSVVKLSLPETSVEAYAAKVLVAGDAMKVVALNGNGNPVSHDALLAAENEAHVAKYGKLNPRLYDFLQSAAPSDIVDVHVWTKVDVPYPSKDELLKDHVALAAHQTTVKVILAAAVEPVVSWLNSTRAPLRNLSSSGDVTSPMIKTALPVSDISTLAALENVAWIDLDVPGKPTSTAWYTNTEVASARALTTASGVTGCVVEGDRPANTTYLRISSTASPTGYTDSHSQLVAGIMSNTYTGNTTSVTDGSIAIGNWDQFSFNSTYPQMWAWCNAQGTPVENFSWAFASGTDPNFESIDSEIDWYAKNSPYPLIVAVSGNDGGYCQNKNRDGLIVGGSDDKGTTSTADDTIYSGSGWQNPSTTHNDLEMPAIIAPAVGVYGADQAGTGTSLAAPQAAAAAMLMVARDSSFAGWPEEARAVLMATATTNVDGSAFSNLQAGGSDAKDGTGRLDTYNATLLADSSNSVGTNNTARARGRSHINMSLANDFTNGFYNGVWNIQPSTTGHVRVIATWDATASCSGPGGSNCSESLDADLDLYVYNGSGSIVCTSSSYDSSWEGCDFSVSSGSQYTVKVYQVSRNRSDTYFALAWFNY
jgi:hypothetical protein